MTKKHFIAIAAKLRERINYAGTADETLTIEGVARELCGTFAQLNPAFDRGRFLAACGVAA